MSYHKDPRRIQPLMDFLMDAFTHLDFNAELSFDAVKVISLYSAVFEGLGRKFSPWTDDMVERSWAEIHGEHDDVCIKCKKLRNGLICDPQVRAFVGEILAFSHNVKESLHF
jgi:proteasome activator subunit 4